MTNFGRVPTDKEDLILFVEIVSEVPGNGEKGDVGNDE